MIKLPETISGVKTPYKLAPILVALCKLLQEAERQEKLVSIDFDGYIRQIAHTPENKPDIKCILHRLNSLFFRFSSPLTALVCRNLGPYDLQS